MAEDGGAGLRSEIIVDSTNKRYFDRFKASKITVKKSIVLELLINLNIKIKEFP